jgi:ribonuclease D
VTATQEIGWIDNDAALAPLVAALEHVSIAAIDTEFVREKTYYPQLCLIQVGTGGHAACIDCLADLDLTPLYARRISRWCFSSRAACRRGSSTRR